MFSDLGSKFTTKTTQNISMEATVNFTEGLTTNSYEDPFCKGQNSYAQVCVFSLLLLFCLCVIVLL